MLCWQQNFEKNMHIWKSQLRIYETTCKITWLEMTQWRKDSARFMASVQINTSTTQGSICFTKRNWKTILEEKGKISISQESSKSNSWEKTSAQKICKINTIETSGKSRKLHPNAKKCKQKNDTGKKKL